ncbi:MAG: hypothetical protein LQ340_005849 [Diploschistes diacapsis]|nr:MAG: hypothetical protein LQ340_005849 [Diploschistes diacapsis]
MRFLCLHGMGTNSNVLETQLAFYPSNDSYFQYFSPNANSLWLAISQLSAYVEQEGPFDGAIAFSQGASLVSTYLLQFTRQKPGEPLPFRCAIFFAGARPFDVIALAKGSMKHVNPAESGPLLCLPTAHVWGRDDPLRDEQSEVLWLLCSEAQRDLHVHEKGHEIPGARAKEDVQRCVRLIHRTIDKASVDV